MPKDTLTDLELNVLLNESNNKISYSYWRTPEEEEKAIADLIGKRYLTLRGGKLKPINLHKIKKILREYEEKGSLNIFLKYDYWDYDSYI
jgi:hypothetical protein